MYTYINTVISGGWRMSKKHPSSLGMFWVILPPASVSRSLQLAGNNLMAVGVEVGCWSWEKDELDTDHLAVCQNLVPLVNIKIAGKWMFIPLKMVCIGIDAYTDLESPAMTLLDMGKKRHQDFLDAFLGHTKNRYQRRIFGCPPFWSENCWPIPRFFICQVLSDHLPKCRITNLGLERNALKAQDLQCHLAASIRQATLW